MGGCFNNCVRKNKAILILFLSFIGVAAIIVAFQIGPLTEEGEMLPKDHPLVKTRKLISDQFSTTSSQKDAFVVKMVWGIKDLDRSNVGLWDP